VKGCAFFAVVFFLGIGLVIGGFIYDVVESGASFQDAAPARHAVQHHDDDERQILGARILEVAGIAVMFSAIFGAAGWRFYHRERDPDSER
jgi:hypothetical protein